LFLSLDKSSSDCSSYGKVSMSQRNPRTKRPTISCKCFEWSRQCA